MEWRIRRRAAWLAYCTIFACVGCGAAKTRIENGDAFHATGDKLDKPIKSLSFERVGSPIVLARSGDKTFAYIANADDATLHTLDVDGREEVSTTELPEAPTDLLLTSDGRLIVLFRNASRIQLFRLHEPHQQLEPGPQRSVPVDPVGLALSADERTLFVTSAWGRTISAYRTNDLSRLWQRRLEREPWDMVLSDDGTQAFVSHAVGGRVSVVSLEDPNAEPFVIPIVSTPELDAQAARAAAQATKRQRANPSSALAGRVPTAAPAIRKPARVRLGLQNFSLAKSVSPAGRILIPGVLVDPGNRELASSGYGDAPLTELSNIAVLDADRAEVLAASVDPAVPVTTSLGWGERAPQCLLPRAATVDPKTDTLLVACSGMDVVMAFDAGSADPRSARVGSWPVAQDPIGIAIDVDRRRALIWSQQQRRVNFIELDAVGALGAAAQSDGATEHIELSRKAHYEKAELALGRALFHRVGDRRISADGRGCASCHVDGRDDGLTWATPSGPRQTPALAGRLRGTLPFGWDGEGSDLESHLSHTFQRLRGAGLSERELAALMAYVESLALPTRSEEGASGERERGQSIFFSAQTGCGACHFGSAFTDGQMHDVGSRVAADRDARFNTPSLLGVGASAPYLHDGRFASLEQMLIAMDGRMGKTKHLSPGDLGALVAYLQSL